MAAKGVSKSEIARILGEAAERADDKRARFPYSKEEAHGAKCILAYLSGRFEVNVPKAVD